jgi:hypothetical protein
MALRSIGIPEGCRVRGESVSRVEGFSDAGFAFALTLLVISLEVPRSFDELVDGLKGLPAFAACFAILVWLWSAHYRFFRRYGLEDTATIALNAAFLFVVMLYVFPLKFSFTIFMGMITGIQPSNTGRISLHQVDDLFVLYGLGFLAAFGLLGWMTWRAWRLRDALDLNEMERLVTREELVRCFSLAGLGCVGVAAALALPDRVAGMAGTLYGLIGVIEYFIGRRFGGMREATLKAMRERGEWPA